MGASGRIAPLWLIAGREFRAYTATLSFWIALMIGPLFVAGGALLTGANAPRGGEAFSLSLTRQGDHGSEVKFSPGFPLSEAGRAEVLRVLRDDPQTQGAVRLANAEPEPALDTDGLSRFALVIMLWMTLTGSLGMLLQAVVRERSSKALESLLSAAAPWQIVLGKLAGVGAVSIMILGAWLASSGAVAAFTPASDGLVAALLHQMATPLNLLRAVAIYLLAFGFYGLTTVALGAMARDNADAQNLARPLFMMLLVVFFTAMAAAVGGARSLGWLVFAPPFTPFMLLMRSQPPGVEAAALAGLAAATWAAGWWAISSLKLQPARLRLKMSGSI